MDFVASRGMMIVGGLLLAGASAGVYSFMTGVPEDVAFDAFARAWAAPFTGATTELGTRSLTVGFGAEFGPHVLPTSFRGKPVEATLHREALILEVDGEARRVPFLAAQSVHLWYATNADRYGATAEEALDARMRTLRIDLSLPLQIVRAPNAAGVSQVYFTQHAWRVDPGVCKFEVAETHTLPTCEPEGRATPCGCVDARVVLVDAIGTPVTREFTLVHGGAETPGTTDGAEGFALETLQPRTWSELNELPDAPAASVAEHALAIVDGVAAAAVPVVSYQV